MASTDTQIISYSPSSSSSSSSSSSESVDQITYEVFLSFRGEDTRYGFTDHLYQALICYGIHTFRDDNELERGRVIESELLNAIAKSKIFVIIFSENYATSSWCLDELVKINECMAAEQRLILPIFYHVDPSEVRKQAGSYGKAFVDHKKEANEEKREKIQKWRAALTEVGNLAGYDLKNYGYETRLIKKIVNDILTKLNSKLSLEVSVNVVGMNFHLKKLKPLIKVESNDIRMIGIYGLGGIGKTTISKVVYNNICHLFESSIFLENVRERSQNYSSRLQLQKDLLNGIIKGKSPEINNTGEGIKVIKRSLCSKKVLLILDDVDKLDQLQLLAVELGSFGPGSRIIITTRDQHLLMVNKVCESYKVEELEFEESVQLLCQHAFEQNVPKNDYVNLSHRIVNYVKGLPLALKDLGYFLFGKSVLEWESMLQSLKRNPNMYIQKLLRGDFEFPSHDFRDQEGYPLNSSPSNFDGKNLVELDLEHSNLKHLWQREKLLEELKVLNVSSSQQLTDMPCYSNMLNLKELNIGHFESLDKVESLLRELTFLDLGGYVKELNLSGASIKELPSSISCLHNLTCLELGDCKNLRSLPSSICKLKSLERLCLNCCSNFETFPEIMENMECLVWLDLRRCKKLRNLPSSICRLKSLESLCLQGCSNLETFPEIMEDMECLKELDLSGCSNLKTFPSSIGRLKVLEKLDLTGCPNLVTEDMEFLPKRLMVAILTGRIGCKPKQCAPHTCC